MKKRALSDGKGRPYTKQLEAHAQTVALDLAENQKASRPGQLRCQKLRMMREPELVAGFHLVFPNNKHQERRDGFGCASLSPMRLGPVLHGQPGLPPAQNIENYHQFNKCFVFEHTDNKPLPPFYEKRNEAYLDPVPHRHKYEAVEITRQNAGQLHAPSFSVHLDATGAERHYQYVESRFFYCVWYEKLATQQEDFQTLCDMLDRGWNLCICGYDAYDPTLDLYAHYCDGNRPFGHELVLYTLLSMRRADRSQYPWRRYYAEHKELYDPLPFEI